MNSIGIEQTLVSVRPGIERLSVSQFQRMIEQGILREGQPIELIDGILVRKDNSDRGGDPKSHGVKHAYCLQRLKEIDQLVRPLGFHLRQQLPVTLSDNRAPEPDGAIVPGVAADYLEQHPTGASCRAVIEVSDSSLEYDQSVKKTIYAAAGIPVYVIVNIPDRQVEVYTTPIPDEARYCYRTDFRRGSVLELSLAKDQVTRIEVNNLLPDTR